MLRSREWARVPRRKSRRVVAVESIEPRWMLSTLPAPTQVVAIPNVYAGIDLVWSSDPSADFFEIDRAPAGSTAFVDINQTSATFDVNNNYGASFTDQSAQALQTYSYRIIAMDSMGDVSPPSAIVQATAPFAAPGISYVAPTAPSPSSELGLYWDTADGDPPFQTEIDRSDSDGAPFHQVAIVPTGVFYYTDTNLLDASDYTYEVRAISGSNSSIFSIPSTGTTLAIPPGNLTATDSYANQTTLAWTNASTRGSGIRISRSDNTGYYNVIAGIPTTDTSYTDTTVLPGLTYQYEVDRIRPGPYGSENPSSVSVTLPAAPLANIKATPTSISTIDLGWTITLANATGVEVDESTDGTHFKRITPKLLPGDSMGFHAAGLKTNTHYWFRARVFQRRIASAFMALDARSLSRPPSSLRATLSGFNQVDLAWKSAGAVGATFDVQRAHFGRNDYVTVGTTTDTKFQDVIEPGASKYQYRVESENASMTLSQGSNVVIVDSKRVISGYPDTTFGNQGIVGTFGGSVTSELIQPDGRIVVAGSDTFGNFAIARFNEDGSVDSGFATDGHAVISSVELGVAAGMALAKDGSIFVTGSNAAGDAAAAHFDRKGVLDSRYGFNGVATVTFPGFVANTLVVLGDGRVVLAGGVPDSVGGYYGNFFLAMARLTARGRLDPTFGVGGKLLSHLEPGSPLQSGIVSMVVQSNGRLVAAAGDALLRFRSDGRLDPAFAGGKGYMTLADSFFAVSSVALAADGKILADENGQITRLSANGVVDPSFSDPHFPSRGGAYRAIITVGPSGDILVSGGSDIPGSGQTAFFIAKLLPSGQPDPGFGPAAGDFAMGGAGMLTIQYYPASVCAEEPNGDIVQAGVFSNGWGLWRFLPNGNTDLTFNYHGNDQSPDGLTSEIVTVQAQSSGKIVAAGTDAAIAVEQGGPALIRYNTNGVVDPTFGINGRAHLAIDGGSNLFAMQVEPNDDIVVACTSPTDGLVVARFLPDGQLDASFGQSGIASIVANLLSGSALSTMPNGDIVILGTDFEPTILIRLLPDGSLDSTFGTDGIDSLAPQFATGMVVRADGKIVLGTQGFGLVRLNSDGSFDSSFGVNGVVGDMSLFSLYYQANSIAMDDQGRIVVGGVDSDGPLPRYLPDGPTLMRYLPDGTLDPSFGIAGILQMNFTITSDGTVYYPGPIEKLAILSNGEIAFAGAATSAADQNPSRSYVALASPVGQDTQFGPNGGTILTIYSYLSGLRDLTTDNHGNLLASGAGIARLKLH